MCNKIKCNFFHNVNGVIKRDKENDNKRDGHFDCEVLQQYILLGADILCLCKTNINWKTSILAQSGSVRYKNLGKVAECLSTASSKTPKRNISTEDIAL